jgi:hypothetical protein
MIYSDAKSANDTDREPACRLGACLNCGNGWAYHFGWRCVNIPSVEKLFSRLPEKYRFITQEMKDSINGPITQPVPTLRSPSASESKIVDIFKQDIADYERRNQKQPVAKEEVPEWKKWRDANVNTGDCPCGLIRSTCEYHR